MTTTDPTPDAVRAAIAELCRRAIVYGQDTTIATLKELQAAERGVDNALTQLGAVPAAGMVTISREDLESALDAMSYVQDTYFWDKWKYQEPYDRLTAALTNGADDGGA